MAETPKILDLRELMCPLPIFKINQALQNLSSGTSIEIWATDPATPLDLKSWTKRTGHILLKESSFEKNGQTIYQFWIQHK